MLELLKRRGSEPAFILLQDAENMYRWVLQGGNPLEDATDDYRGQYDDPEDTSGHSDNPDDEAEEYDPSEPWDDDEEFIIDDEDDALTSTLVPRKSD